MKHNGRVLLTDDLIDRLHAFRIGLMAASLPGNRLVRADAAGASLSGGYAKFVGEGSPLTQVYGVGHSGCKLDLRELDEFYAGRAKNWELIVTPFSPDLLAKAHEFGYVPDHFETVLVQHVDAKPYSLPAGASIEVVGGDTQLWMEVTEAAWMERDELVPDVSELMRLTASQSAIRYLARIDGEPAATASLLEHEGCYLFAGACTLPRFRGRGLQQALSSRRIAGAGSGALVQVVALPGSKSHRNLQRIGFQPLYSKLVMMRTK